MPVFLDTPQPISMASLTNGVFGPLTSGAPAGTTGVILNYVCPSGFNLFTSFRMTGSTDTQTFLNGNGSNGMSWYITGVDSLGRFDMNTSDHTHGTLYLTGYFGSEAVFFQNSPYNYVTTSSFVTNSLAANCPGAIAAIFDINGGGNGTNLYQPGSSDVYILGTPQSAIVGLDSGQNYRIRNANGATLYLRGYLSTGISWHQNSTAVGGSFTAGVFQNVAKASGDPGDGSITGYVYYTLASGANVYSLAGPSCNTGSYDPQHNSVLGSGGSQAFCGGSTNGSPSQIKPSNSAQALNELAYFFPVLPPQISMFSAVLP